MWETTAPAMHFAARSAAAEVRRRAKQIVDPLLDELMFTKDVIEHVQADSTLTEAVRTAALLRARLRGDRPASLNNRSWQTVRKTGADIQVYRRALAAAEAACRLRPNDGTFVNTLGVALYRVAAYHEALSTLRQAETLNAARYPAGHPADVAFMAMSLHQLGQVGAARTTLERLRTLMQHERWQVDEEAQAFLAEAEALLGGTAGRLSCLTGVST